MFRVGSWGIVHRLFLFGFIVTAFAVKDLALSLHWTGNPRKMIQLCLDLAIFSNIYSYEDMKIRHSSLYENKALISIPTY